MRSHGFALSLAYALAFTSTALAQAPAAAPAAPPVAPAEQVSPQPGTPPVAAEPPGTGPEVEELVPVEVPPPAPAVPKQAESKDAEAKSGEGDKILYSGYLPGYRRHMALGYSPYAPNVGSPVGGFTSSPGAPVPPSDWEFTFKGSLTSSLQVSTNTRLRTGTGQSETVLHTLPETIETYWYFTSTNSVPGNWASLQFRYGNARVSANVSIDTYNPSRPTTYYQLGSQNFVNNAFLSYTPEPVGGFRLRIDAGYYVANYGVLSVYGSAGAYVNAIVGQPQGVGTRIVGEYDLSDDYVLTLEHGLVGRRDGQLASNVVQDQSNGWRRPLWASALIHHAHVGVVKKSEPRIETTLHYISNWSQEDRNGLPIDNPGTLEVDESHLKDGRITVYGIESKLLSDWFGVVGVGASYLVANNAFPLKGMQSYGGFGEELTQRWFGVPSGGTGKLFVLGVNYLGSLGKILSHPVVFDGQGPDVVIETAFHFTHTQTSYEPYDGRLRHKGAFNVLYTFSKYVGIGARADYVVPNSKNSNETYYVLAPRIQLKTDWQSRETLTFQYAKWFLGSETRNEGTGLRSPELLDDQLFSCSVRLWW